jgi:hypothetical protein
MMRNVLSVAKIPPAAVTASQMARIAPRIVPMIRPMYPVCTRGSRQAAMVPAALPPQILYVETIPATFACRARPARTHPDRAADAINQGIERARLVQTR